MPLVEVYDGIEEVFQQSKLVFWLDPRKDLPWPELESAAEGFARLTGVLAEGVPRVPVMDGKANRFSLFLAPDDSLIPEPVHHASGLDPHVRILDPQLVPDPLLASHDLGEALEEEEDGRKERDPSDDVRDVADRISSPSQEVL